MAFSVRITGTSRSTGKTILELEPRWWDPDELKKDERFTETETGGYLDYEADLSLEEVRQIHEKYKLQTTSGLYALPSWQQVIQPIMKTLDEALYSRSDDDFCFNVTVFEWESGLGD